MSTETTPTTAASGTTMRAITQERYGGSEVLGLSQVARPALTHDQVMIAVRAAGLDRGTEHLMTGKPYAMRLGFGIRRPRNPVLGRDVSGTVVQVGAAVAGFAPGDEVYGVAPGSFAEYAVTGVDKLARKPRNISFTEAATVPISAGTALQALTEAGNVEAGQSVLVTGASGGVGSYAVQLARMFGAEVTGVASTNKLDYVTSLGAHHVVDYTCETWADGTRRYDLILDIAGNPPVHRMRRALAPRGTVVFVGGEHGGTVTGMGRQLRGALLVSPLVRQRFTLFLARERSADYEQLTCLIESGRITPRVDSSFPLEHAADAMRLLQEGEVRGKVALTIEPSPALQTLLPPSADESAGRGEPPNRARRTESSVR